MDKRNWKLTIGIDHFYLTEKEKDYYLEHTGNGSNWVMLASGKIFSKNFQSLVPIEAIEETLKIDNGRWQCEYGKWHEKGWECTCNLKNP